MASLTHRKLMGLRFRLSSGMGLALASRRNTASSRPLCVGIVATRNSKRWPCTNLLKLILPSCGLRRSEMSSSHMIFSRAISALR